MGAMSQAFYSHAKLYDLMFPGAGRTSSQLCTIEAA